MVNCLQLVNLHLNTGDFRLLWNGKAMIDWNSGEYAEAEITTSNPEVIAKILHLMAREAAAVCNYYGYPADTVPDEQDLLEYLSIVAQPWEMSECVVAIATALQLGNHKDYKPEQEDRVDIDTILLKKN